VQLPPLPETAAVPHAENAPNIGLAPVRDARPDERSGRVGMLKLTAGPESKDYLQGSATRKLSELGYLVVAAPDPGSRDGTPRLATPRVVLLTLQTLSIDGEGLGPVQAAATLTASVYDGADTVVYSHTFRSLSNDVFGLTANPEALAGKIMASALDQAVASVVADPRFLAAVH
jgi:hypothetical protein